MKKFLSIILISFCFYLYGCSVPARAVQPQLYSLTREEKKIKAGFGKRKVVLVKDFRGNEMYEEDMDALKEEVEEYILAHPDLSETTKANLRQLKVMPGQTQAQVELLLGSPDKLTRAGRGAPYGANEIWIYKISKIRAVTVFIVPVGLVHEGYYLYFSRPAIKSEGGIPLPAGRNDILAGIERHYPEQIVQQGSAPGAMVGGEEEEDKEEKE